MYICMLDVVNHHGTFCFIAFRKWSKISKEKGAKHYLNGLRWNWKLIGYF